jgi:hypothetical protein
MNGAAELQHGDISLKNPPYHNKDGYWLLISIRPVDWQSAEIKVNGSQTFYNPMY